MTVLSRRDFGRVVVAGIPVAALTGVRRLSAAGPIALGITTDSLRELPRTEGRDNIDDVIKAVRAIGATRIELSLANLEPAPPATAPVMGGSAAYPRLVILTPQQIAATNAGARAALRTWRLQADTGFIEQVRGKITAAGLTVHACAICYDTSFTDEEIDVTFRQAQALGVTTISSPLTMAMAARIAPFADRHRMSVAIHNQVDGNAAGEIGTADLPRALAMTPAFMLKLDVGHLTAANCDALAEFKSHQTRVSHVVLKDRLRNGGASQVFGEGDTPIREVLSSVKASPRSIPVFVEYDYVGLRSAVDEVKASLAYAERAAR
jgi:sugar phosphate isomerase/epimerase